MSNLFSRICRPDTLRRAWSRVQKRGQTPGVDGVTLEYFGQKAERRLARLGRQLSEGRYQPRPLRRCEVSKRKNGVDGSSGSGSGKETRVLAIPAVRDRVAQAAALLSLQPVISTWNSSARRGIPTRSLSFPPPSLPKNSRLPCLP